MVRFGSQQVVDDLSFWRNMIEGMVCAVRSGVLATVSDTANEVPAPAHANGTDPGCLFGIVSADNAACCAIDCGTCEEAGCWALPPGLQDCCPSHIVLESRPCSTSFA